MKVESKSIDNVKITFFLEPHLYCTNNLMLGFDKENYNKNKTAATWQKNIYCSSKCLHVCTLTHDLNNN